jgi:hypothetical protein
MMMMMMKHQKINQRLPMNKIQKIKMVKINLIYYSFIVLIKNRMDGK